MAENTDDLIALVVTKAIVGKFNDWEEERVLDLVRRLQSQTDKVFDEGDDLSRDIINQLRCFSFIETEWGDRELNFQLMKELNAYARGLDPRNVVLRSEDYVADFGGRTPTDAADVEAKVNNISDALDRLEAHELENGVEELAVALAEGVCQIIFVHPFPDGNGRTARFLVQLVMRKYGYRYFPIPKYRNDADWRRALDEGKLGQHGAMSSYFLKRMKRL